MKLDIEEMHIVWTVSWGDEKGMAKFKEMLDSGEIKLVSIQEKILTGEPLTAEERVFIEEEEEE